MSGHKTNSVVQRKTSRMAIASFSLTLIGWFLFVVTYLLAMFFPFGSLAMISSFDLTEVIAFSLTYSMCLVHLMWLLSIGLGVGAFVATKVQHLKGSVLAIGGVVLSAVPIICGICLLLIVFPNEVTKVSKYKELRHELWHSPTLIAHFPDEIPDSAKDIRLSYFPGFLQGGAWFQVRMTLPEDTIGQLFEEFDSKKLKSFRGGGWSDHANSDGGVPATFFRTAEPDYRDSSGDVAPGDFPEDFVVMVLGTSHGVAISKPRNQIVYWADDW